MNPPLILKDAARALSLANLCFLGTWNQLIGLNAINVFLDLNINNIIAVLVNVTLLAVSFWTAIMLARRTKKDSYMNLAQVVFLFICSIPAQYWGFLVFMYLIHMALLLVMSGPETIVRALGLAVSMAITLGTLSAIRRWQHALMRRAKFFVTILSPFAILTIYQAGIALTQFSEKPVVPTDGANNTNAPRILWLIYDEMDQQMAFSNRPESLTLSHLDRLRSESIYAKNAYPPSDKTLMSIPALITGRLISHVDPTGPSGLNITFAGSEKAQSLSDTPTIFRNAMSLGVNTRVIGWYIPYCRIISRDLNYCSWQDVKRESLNQSFHRQIKSLLTSIPLITQVGLSNSGEGSQNRQKHKDVFVQTLEEAKKAGIEPNRELTLVHWALPHPPSIYNRKKQDFDVEGQGSYLDNLALVDETVGELRRAMEEAGTWDDTIVLVTSDHWWRTDIWRATEDWAQEDEQTMPAEADHRIPFILKLASQKQGVTYEAEFNTVLTHDLLLALLRGELTGAESVVDWLDKHRSIGESPYVFD